MAIKSPRKVDYKPIHLRVPIKVYNALVDEADLEQMTVSEYIREGIKDRIKRRRRDRRAKELEFDVE